MDPSTTAPFVAETLKILRDEVGPETAVLGFVGCPYTLATYMIEGKTSKEYLEIKKMAFNEPKLLHHILKSLADSIGDYALFQIENGAQLIQIFDSWAGHLSPRDYEEFAAPYQKMILDKVRRADKCSMVHRSRLSLRFSNNIISLSLLRANRSRQTTQIFPPSHTLNILGHCWNAWQRQASMLFRWTGPSTWPKEGIVLPLEERQPGYPDAVVCKETWTLLFCFPTMTQSRNEQRKF